MVKHVTNLSIYGDNFYYGEDIICLGDGGGHESFILEQGIFKAIIDFATQIDFMNKDLSFKAYTYCDYAELYVEQLDKHTVSIYSQFQDGSDREEIQCSTTIFYIAFLKYLDGFFETVLSDAALAEKVNKSFKYMANNYTLEEHHFNYNRFKPLIELYYHL